MKLFNAFIFCLWFCLLGSTQFALSQSLDSLLVAYAENAEVTNRLPLIRQIALSYEKEGIYRKAIEYYQKEAERAESPERLLGLHQKIAELLLASNDQAAALNRYGQLEKLAAEQGDTQTQALALSQIGYLQSRQNQHAKATASIEKSISLTDTNQKGVLAERLNNLGYLWKEIGEKAKAKTTLEKAWQLGNEAFDQASTEQEADQKLAVLGNLVTTLLQLEQQEAALKKLDEAFLIFGKSQNPTALQKVLNLTAATHYNNANNERALATVNQAIEIGKSRGSEQQLATSYRILSEIQAAEKDYEASKTALNQHLDLKQKLQEQEEADRKAAVQKQLDAEKRENQIRQEVAEKREKELLINQLELEAETKAQELALLEKEKALKDAALETEQLEREKVKQALALTEKELEAEKRSKELSELEKQRQLQELRLQQNELQEQERIKEFQLLEAEKKMQAQSLEDEKKLLQYGLWIFALVLILLIGLIIGYIQKRRTELLLRRQAAEIKEKQAVLQQANSDLKSSEEEIRQQSEELLTINEHLGDTLKTLQEAQSQLVQSEKMAALGQLVAGVAHEINTPVGVGITASSHIQKLTENLVTRFNDGEMTEEEFQAYLEDVYEASDLLLKNLLRTADLVQSFKKISSDQTSEKARDFHLKGYIDDVVKSLRPQFKHHALKVTIDCPDDLTLNSYPGTFAQIFTNLFMNAVRHGFKNRAEGTIAIKVTTDAKNLHISFADNGHGMSEEVKLKIFDPFFTTDQQEGTGLGLHILYNLITYNLKGSLYVDSELNKGTTFDLVIPL